MIEKKQQTAYPLRMPAELRDELEELAKRSKRSLNAEIIARLEESVGGINDMGVSDRQWLRGEGIYEQPIRPVRGVDKQRLIESTMRPPITGEVIAGWPFTSWQANLIAERRVTREMTFADCFDWRRDSNAIRLKHFGTTYDAHDQLLTVLATVEDIKSVTLAVREGEGNLSALSIVIRTPELTYVADTTYLTAERPPRESEIRDLVWALDVRGLLGGAVQFRTDHVKQTDSLAPAKAVAAIEEGDKLPLGIKTLQQFLALFHRKDVAYTEQELLKFFAE